MTNAVARPCQGWNSPIPTTDGPRLYVKSEFTKICGGDAITGVLLSLLESWHVTKLRASRQSRTYNDVAQKHGGRREHYEGLLQWHTTKEIIEQTCGLMSERTVRQSIQKLVDLGFVSVHKNPDPRYKFDKTRFFLLDVESVSKAVMASNVVFHADERRDGDDERRDGDDERRDGDDERRDDGSAVYNGQDIDDEPVACAENCENAPSHTLTHTQPTTQPITHRQNDVLSQSFVEPTDEGYPKTNTPPVGKQTGGCWKTNNILDSNLDHALDHTDTTSDALKQRDSPKMERPDTAEEPVQGPTDFAVKEWHDAACRSGCDYTAEEVKAALIRCRLEQWMFKGKPCHDWRLMLEDRIQTVRVYSNKQRNAVQNEPEPEPEPERVPAKLRRHPRMLISIVDETTLAAVTDAEVSDVKGYTAQLDKIISDCKRNGAKEGDELLGMHMEKLKLCKAFLENVAKAKEKMAHAT